MPNNPSPEPLRAHLSRGQLLALVEDLQQIHGEINEQLRQMTVLHDISTTISSALELDQVLRSFLLSLERVVLHDEAHIFLVEDSGQARLWTSRGDVAGGQIIVTFQAGDGPLGRLLTGGETLLLGEKDKEMLRQFVVGRTPQSVLATPLRTSGQVIGLLVLLRYEKGEFTLEQARLVEVVAAQTATAIQNARLYERVQRLAITDDLTGVYNHRYFRQESEAEIRKARRLAYPVGLLMIDIDHFKRFNDTYGHQMGDEVLRAVARTIRDSVRETDTVARYGGEEFVVLLPGCTEQYLRTVAEKVRVAVYNMAIEIQERDKPERVSISIGAASFPSHEATADRLLKRADEALYQAKNTGRNSVCIATDMSWPSEALDDLRPNTIAHQQREAESRMLRPSTAEGTSTAAVGA